MVYKIKTGDKISITESKEKRGWLRKKAAVTAGEESVTYISQVEDVPSNTEIVALVPVNQGILTRLPESVPYIMAFYTLKGMVEHKCRIESYYKDKGSYLMKVRLLDKGKPIQHRQFFRFECMLPIKYNIIREGNLSSDDEKAFSGIIRDLSGGGLCFQANEDMKVGQKIRFSIELDTKLLIAIGTVLRKTEPKDGDYRNEYNVVYSGITGADQERIVRHIFAEQRHNLNVSK